MDYLFLNGLLYFLWIIGFLMDYWVLYGLLVFSWIIVFLVGCWFFWIIGCDSGQDFEDYYDSG